MFRKPRIPVPQKVKELIIKLRFGRRPQDGQHRHRLVEISNMVRLPQVTVQKICDSYKQHGMQFAQIGRDKYGVEDYFDAPIRRYLLSYTCLREWSPLNMHE